MYISVYIYILTKSGPKNTSCYPFSQHFPVFTVALSTFHLPQILPLIFLVLLHRNVLWTKRSILEKNKRVCKTILLQGWETETQTECTRQSCFPIVTSFITMAIDSSSTVLLRWPDENEVCVLCDSLGTWLSCYLFLSLSLYSNPVSRREKCVSENTWHSYQNQFSCSSAKCFGFW